MKFHSDITFTDMIRSEEVEREVCVSGGLYGKKV